MHVFRNLKLADNAIGFTHASGAFGRYAFTSKVVDSLFVGETENIGNPRTDAEKAYGRSLPKPEMPDFPIRGYEYYDYRHDVENVTFRNFQDNATRKTGAMSYLMFTSFGVSSKNSVEHAKFVNAKPVYFPPMERKWGNDNGGSTAYKTAVIRDKDGSFGDGPNSYVLINDGVNDSIAADTQACEIKPTWNAAVCKGDVGRLDIGGARRRRRFRSAWPRCRSGRRVPVPVRARPVVRRTRWSRQEVSVEARRAASSAAGRSQPQWQAIQPDPHQRTSRYRDQGDHRKAVHVPAPERTG